jgi:predicted secreted protein
MSDGTFGNGSTFKLGSNTITELTGIGLPGMSADDIDITTHNDSDRVRQFIKGLIDPGEIAIEGNVLYTDYANLYASMTTTSLESITITLPTSPSTTTFEANGYLKSLEGNSPHDEKIDMSGSIKISGKPVLTEG